MLISPEYAQLNHQLHETRPDYGTSGRHWADLVAALASAMASDLARSAARDTRAVDILDYGCGKQTLAARLPTLDIRGYDPAMPGLQTPPEPADLVVCTDVLEHVEADCIDDVMEDLCRVTRYAAFVTVATRPARKTLADGRNAHLIVENLHWWRTRFLQRFDIVAGHDAAGTELALLLRAVHADESLLRGFDLVAFIR
jgi:hypothetical protein